MSGNVQDTRDANINKIRFKRYVINSPHKTNQKIPGNEESIQQQNVK